MMLTRHILAITLISAACTLSWLRGVLYENEVTLWADTVMKSPDKARPHNNYGHALKEAHRVEEARPHFQAAVAIKPDYTDALNNLATLYNSEGRKNESRMLWERVLAIDPGHMQARSNMALTYYESGQYDEAVRAYSAIISINPYTKEAAFARSMLNLISRDRPAAR